jgi:hypothetical protein
LREYLASMGQIERQLLNEEVRKLRMNIASGDDRDGLTITEARAILPEQTAHEVRVRARNQAWERIAPAEAFENNPLPEAIRISETIAHIQEHLQEKASIAQNARNDFLAEKVREAERRLSYHDGAGNRFSHDGTQKDRDKFVQSVIAGLSPEDARKLSALDHYAAHTRETVYRKFEEIDLHRRNLELARVRIELQRVESSRSSQEVEIFPTNGGSVFVNSDQSVSRVAAQSLVSNEQNERSDKGSISGNEQREPRVVTLPHRGGDYESEWHFDSLRDVIKPDQLGHQFVHHERSDQLDQTSKDNLAFQR